MGEIIYSELFVRRIRSQQTSVSMLQRQTEGEKKKRECIRLVKLGFSQLSLGITATQVAVCFLNNFLVEFTLSAVLEITNGFLLLQDKQKKVYSKLKLRNCEASKVFNSAGQHFLRYSSERPSPK